MTPKQIATALAAGRIAIGTALFIAPGTTGRWWLGPAADDPGAKLATRGLGARDAAIGVGTLLSLERPEEATTWIEAGIAADLSDAVAMGFAAKDRPRSVVAGLLGIAGGAAALGAWLRTALRAEG